jgi:hypothetical protein
MWEMSPCNVETSEPNQGIKSLLVNQLALHNQKLCPAGSLFLDSWDYIHIQRSRSKHWVKTQSEWSGCWNLFLKIQAETFKLEDTTKPWVAYKTSTHCSHKHVRIDRVTCFFFIMEYRLMPRSVWASLMNYWSPEGIEQERLHHVTCKEINLCSPMLFQVRKENKLTGYNITLKKSAGETMYI